MRSTSTIRPSFNEHLSIAVGIASTLMAVSVTLAQQPGTAPSPQSLIPQPSAATQPTNVATLDRVVAIVNGSVILDSDIDEEMRFDRLKLGEEELGPSTEAAKIPSRSATLEMLINRELILQQIRLEPHSDVSDQDVDDEIAQLRASLPSSIRDRYGSDDGWKAYLATAHLTPAEFREHWRERMQVLAFTERRFRMGIRVTTDQEKSYYDHVLLPKYTEAKVKAPPFASIADRIEQVLIEQQVSALLSEWLHSLRAQGTVTVLHPGEDAP